MPISPGTRIGVYQVTGTLGAGGMGEVYRARDTRLDRDVAIKILPDLFAADPDRLARFEREAKTLASLNHPNIAHIYGTEQSGNTHALVMELVEGVDLAQRLQRGPVPIDETLEIARQVAEALECAHEQGIIHRDLKPANIKLRPDGTVKVLDFGLAKAMTPDASSADQLNSPTFTSPATQIGVILGTAAYMAPEQAKGKAVDRRADIWAFGMVVHEMLTGRRMWQGETAQETLAHVISRDADLGELPPSTPPRLRHLLARCLVKDPKLRLRDIGEARVALTEMIAGETSAAPAVATRRARSSWVPWVAAALMTVVAAMFAALWARTPAPARAPVVRAAFEPPPNKVYDGSLALSPDGRRLVFAASGGDQPNSSLWVRDLESGIVTEIKHTGGGSRPFWSPDGAAIGFFADNKLKRVDLQGSPPQALADAPTARGGAWSRDNRIVFAPAFRGGLYVVNAGGGTPTQLTNPEGNETSHRWPMFLPESQLVMFLSQTSEGGTRDDTSSIDVVALDGRGRRKLLAANSSPLYAAPGLVLFFRDGSLVAQSLNTRTNEITGQPFVVTNDVAYDQNEAVLASVSALGQLVYLRGGAAGKSAPTLVDRTGRAVRPAAPAGDYECGLALSPDGKQLAFGRTPEGTNGCDLWVLDLERGVETLLTFERRNQFAPIFTPDGRAILFGSEAGRNAVYRQPIGARREPELLIESGAGIVPQEPAAITRDGRTLILTTVGVKTRFDISRYDLTSKRITPIVETPFQDVEAALSPDERWIAYVSDRSGRGEVYVEPLSGEGAVWQVSADGGSAPRWRADGRELFFLGAPDQIMSAAVVPGPVFRTAAPVQLFRAPLARFAPYAVMPDGQQFIANLIVGSHLRQSLTFVSDWRPR